MKELTNCVMLKTDNEGNIVGKHSVENISNFDYSNLEDGLYVFYRGTDWVFGNDASLVNTAVIYEGESQTYSQSFTKNTEVRKASSTGITFDLNYIQLAITQAYDVTISDAVTKTVTINQTSPIGDTFYKIYLTYSRYDVVRIKNGQTTHSASTYEFMGGRSVITNVPKGQIGTIDTEKLVIKEDKCLLNAVEDSMWQIIDNSPNVGNLNIGRESGGKIFDLNANMSFGTFTYNSPSCNQLNFIFNISEHGTYVFLTGRAANLDLYTLNENNRDQITKIDSKKSDNINDTYIKRELKSGNYVLTISTNNDVNNQYSLLIQKQ